VNRNATRLEDPHARREPRPHGSKRSAMSRHAAERMAAQEEYAMKYLKNVRGQKK
jgi:hypothetical protein